MKLLAMALVMIPAVATISCAKKPSPDVSQNSGQSVQQDTTNMTLRKTIEKFYTDILGRAPTEAEIQAAISQIKSGLNPDQLRLQIAQSAEAINKIVNLLIQTLGNTANLTNILNSWINQLGNGATLNQLLQNLQHGIY